MERFWVSQLNSAFDALDTLVVTVHSVKEPVGFGLGLKTIGRLSFMVHPNKSILEVKAVDNCLAHALIIALVKVDKDPNYKSYRDGWKIRPVVRNLLDTIGIDLSSGAVIPELVRFQEHFREYKITVSGFQLWEHNVWWAGRIFQATYFRVTSKDTRSRIWRLIWLDVTCVKYVTKAVGDTLRMCVTRRLTNAWLARRALSKVFDSPAKIVKGTLEIGHVSIAIKWVC